MNLNTNFKVYVIPLVGALALYQFALKAKKSPITELLESIPKVQEQMSKIYQDIGVEVLKVLGAYVALYFVMKLR